MSLPGGRWLEPGVGNGDIVRAVHAKRSDVRFVGIDKRTTKFIKNGSLHAKGDEYVVGDLLRPKVRVAQLLNGPQFDVAFGNPPYNIAPQVIDLCLKAAKVTALLLRLNYLSSEKRHALMRATPPDIYVLPNRPSFTGTGSDSVEYAWFVFYPQQGARVAGKLRVLALTPRTERRGHSR